MPKNYYVIAWEWDRSRLEYRPICKDESDDYEEMLSLFNSIKADADSLQIELWELGEEEDIRLAMKEAE